jgi:hypothetical protein
MRKQTNTLSPCPKGFQSPKFSDSDFSEVCGLGLGRPKSSAVSILVFSNLFIQIVLLLLGKEEVKDADPAVWTKKSNLPEVTKSWHDYMTKEVIQDFQSAILQVSDSPYDEEYVANIPQVAYEFPNGYRNEFGLERFKISEALFDPNKIRVPNANTMLSVAHVLTTSVGKI